LATFTVVVPAFNAAAGVAGTVAAVLEQVDVDLEVVVVDDGSTDDTAAIVGAIADPRVRLVEQPNRGVSAARNRGLGEATGELVTFLDCDDRPEPTWLARFAELLEQPDVAVAFVGATYRDAAGRETAAATPEDHGPAFYGLSALWLTGTMAARTDFLRALGGFAVGLAYSENTELGLRVAAAIDRQGQRAASTSEPLITLFDPGGARSRAYSSEARQASAAYLVSRHHRQLHREPRLLGIYYSMLGVSAVRLREPGAARWFGKAVLADPRQPRHAARLAAALVPPVARAIWSASPSPEDD
jgi:glycosyltransferase involved in cell wall biosynthesis